MRKPDFLPQRFLRHRTETIPLQTGLTIWQEWILARSICHYHLFKLQDIPAEQRDNVLHLKIQQWSPFSDFGQYVVWQQGYAQVWIWDKRWEPVDSDKGLKKITFMPESILFAKSPLDDNHIIQCAEGFEGQIWKDGILIGSRWWAQPPKLLEWTHFQRTHGLAATDTLPTVTEPTRLSTPWGKPKANWRKLLKYREQLGVALGVIGFTLILTWQLVSIAKWQWATYQLQTQIDQLNDQINPILTARNQALNDRQQFERLLALIPYPTQLDLLTQVAEKLPLEENARLLEWFYQNGELKFMVEAKTIDPTFYVTTFQAIPGFKEVKAETPPANPQRIVVSLRLEPAVKR